MHSKEVVRKIFGANSMVRIKQKDVDLWCLGFVLETNMFPAIEIGGHQLGNNLFQFDLQSNRLGFTSSALGHGTSCANFNFND